MNSKIFTQIRQILDNINEQSHLTTDTRSLNYGDIFLAYCWGNQYQKRDNRIYIKKALDLGAKKVFYDSENLQKICFSWINERCYEISNLSAFIGYFAHEWYKKPTEEIEIFGITGTNGKTSITHYLAQALSSLEYPTAIIGTLGAGFINKLKYTGFTTPNAVFNHRFCREIVDQKARAIAMEISSHALDQNRIQGMKIDTAIITNLSQDHLDYHKSMEEYALTKKKILNISTITSVIINIDDKFGIECLEHLFSFHQKKNIKVFLYTTETNYTSFFYKNCKKISARNIKTRIQGTSFSIFLNEEFLGFVETKLIGLFNVSNLLAVCASLLIKNYAFNQIVFALNNIQQIPGRLQPIMSDQFHLKPTIFIDFAHTPTALQCVLETLRLITISKKGNLWIIFGCGGDRDRSKRSKMGRIAESLADYVVLTNDNPRHEDPYTIVQDIIVGFKAPSQAIIILDRQSAISEVIQRAKPEDVILIAGKGHENTQDIYGKKILFSDYSIAKLILEKYDKAYDIC